MLKITFNDLIQSISADENLSICKNEYSEQHFGNFLVKFKYKNSLLIQMLNDRGVIELSVSLSKLLFNTAIPFRYVVDFVNGSKSPSNNYTFNSIDEAYSFFKENNNILDDIIKNNMMRKIAMKWKRCC